VCASNVDTAVVPLDEVKKIMQNLSEDIMLIVNVTLRSVMG
jgi:hypothetical protein